MSENDVSEPGVNSEAESLQQREETEVCVCVCVCGISKTRLAC